jgi:hypothetical protein
MPNLKHLLLSASARSIKACMFKPDAIISFIQIHEINLRATPNQIMIYKDLLLLHKLYNGKQPLTAIYLNFQHQFLMRQGLFTVAKTNKYEIGESILVNRLSVVNNLILLDWLNLTYATYKLKCKEKFVTGNYQKKKADCKEEVGRTPFVSKPYHPFHKSGSMPH